MSVIDTNKLSHILAEYAGITEEETSRFLESFASVISKHVKNGEDVEVQGLGKFIVIDTKQAEMRRVALMLAESMKDEVNSPFSFFEPYVISKGSAEDTGNDSEHIIEERAEDAVVVIEESHDDAEYIDSSETSEVVGDTVPDDDEIEIKKEVASEQDDDISKDRIKENVDDKIEHVNKDNHNKSNLWVILCIVLSLFLIGFILWFVFGNRNNETAIDSNDYITTENSFVDDSICESTDTIEQVIEIPHILADSVGNPIKVTLQQGERLTLIALRYFGSKDFWPYVYEVNKDRITSPSNVHAGAVLYLPNPSYFEIDALSTESVEKAKEFGREILNNK